MTSTSESEPKFGFYTVDFTEKLGWTGGYLLLNARGRPLEFHCTLPVRPTRSQEILYGNSLKPMLIGESIADAILQRARLCPDLLLVDQPEAAVLAQRPDLHVLVLGEWGSADFPSGVDSESWHRFPIDTLHAACPARSKSVTDALLSAAADLNDWEEPFERIREAIREAQQSVANRAA